MTERDDYSYFLQRAQRERELAEACTENVVALAHRRLAAEYERRTAAGPPPVPDIARTGSAGYARDGDTVR